MPFEPELNKISSQQDAKYELITEIHTSIGGSSIDIELEIENYELAIKKAFDRYRTRSTNAREESFVFLNVQPDIQVYTLPQETTDVYKLYRRQIGSATGNGALIDPFSSSLVSSLYTVLLGNGNSNAGNLATYELSMDYQKLLGRMFGLELDYNFNRSTKQLLIQRRIAAQETLLIYVDKYKPENVLLADVNARQWLRDWSIADVKQQLGEARSYLASYPGSGGGISLNGDALKQESLAEKQRLEDEVMKQMDGALQGYGFMFG